MARRFGFDVWILLQFLPLFQHNSWVSAVDSIDLCGHWRTSVWFKNSERLICVSKWIFRGHLVIYELWEISQAYIHSKHIYVKHVRKYRGKITLNSCFHPFCPAQGQSSQMRSRWKAVEGLLYKSWLQNCWSM